MTVVIINGIVCGTGTVGARTIQIVVATVAVARTMMLAFLGAGTVPHRVSPPIGSAVGTGMPASTPA